MSQKINFKSRELGFWGKVNCGWYFVPNSWIMDEFQYDAECDELSIKMHNGIEFSGIMSNMEITYATDSSDNAQYKFKVDGQKYTVNKLINTFEDAEWETIHRILTSKGKESLYGTIARVGTKLYDAVKDSEL